MSVYEYPPANPGRQTPNVFGLTALDILAIDLQHAAAVATHGDDPMTREQAAAHEAGHMVVGHAVGMLILGASIFRDGSDWAGRTRFCTPGAEMAMVAVPVASNPRLGLMQAKMNLAGFAGELVAGFHHPASSLDERYQARLICSELEAAAGQAPGMLFEKVAEAAIRCIQVNLQRFRVIQGHLQRNRKLNGADARRLLAGCKKERRA